MLSIDSQTVKQVKILKKVPTGDGEWNNVHSVLTSKFSIMLQINSPPVQLPEHYHHCLSSIDIRSAVKALQFNRHNQWAVSPSSIP